MCVYFTNSNKGFEGFIPLPIIDQMVDGLPCYELLSFMDVFSGYNQIKMMPEHE